MFQRERPVCSSAACQCTKKSAIRGTYPIDNENDPNERREIGVGLRYSDILGIINNKSSSQAQKVMGHFMHMCKIEWHAMSQTSCRCVIGNVGHFCGDFVDPVVPHLSLYASLSPSHHPSQARTLPVHESIARTCLTTRESLVHHSLQQRGLCPSEMECPCQDMQAHHDDV